MSPKTLTDREAIEEVRHQFGVALDTRDWELFESLFSEDAVGDFSSFGVPTPAIGKAAIVGLFQQAFSRPASELRT